MLYEAVFGLTMLRQLFILLVHFNSYSMKKSILTGIALLGFAAVTYAQNSATVNQNGTMQTAVANQSGNGQTSTISQVQSATATNFGNFAGTKQTGTATNTATVNQNNGSNGNRAYATQETGSGNTATINQNDNSGGGTTKATETMAGGAGNLAGTFQTGGNGNTATVNQNNDSQRNTGEVRQNGSTNTGTVNQSNTSKDNVGRVYQGFADNTTLQPLTGITSSTATINQGKAVPTDVSFTSGVTAESLNNEATIVQTADNNKATINQGATGDLEPDGAISAGRSVGSKATVNQSNTGNTATVNQGVESGESLGSMATVTQTGTGNTSRIDQGGLQNGHDNGSKGTISQAGTNSLARIFQSYLGVGSNGNEATITQTANANGANASIYQAFGGNSTSSNDKAEIMQGGTGTNLAQIVQGTSANVGTASSSGNMAMITQADGTSNNEARISQGRDDLGSAIDNKATIKQVSGNGSAAFISQGRAISSVDVRGVAFNFTDGTGATLTTGAKSTSSTASITQDGSTNTGLLFQADGTGTGGNMATLIQTGSTNAARLYQEGTKQTSTITQTGNNNTLDGGAANSFATQLGDTNTATVMQTSAMGSAGNMAHLMQAGSGNNAMITQSATAMPN